MILDYCKKGDLAQFLKKHSRLNEKQGVFIICELILAIIYIHKANIIYRDLKPSNILIDDHGHIKLTDFGLSKHNFYDYSKSHSFVGTPAYVAPEVLRNKGAGKAVDLYGIGMVFYEILVGKSPFFNLDIGKMYTNI